MPTRTLLIDQDILLFKFACTNEYGIHWGEDLDTKIIDTDVAIAAMDEFIYHLLEVTNCVDYYCTMTHQDNFRYVVLPTYKHNRKGKERPELIQILKDYTLANHPHKYKPWCEADDLLGIMATKWPGKFVIATIDKDLNQIPGYHYRFNQPKKGVFEISEEEAQYFFWRQILTGDSVDGYPGCPGCGPKAADYWWDIMDPLSEEDRWQVVLDVYADAPEWRIKQSYQQDTCITEAQILQQAQVARICRAEDYDFEKEEVIFWKPKHLR